MIIKLCKTCIYYIPKTKKVGNCHKSAPTIEGWPKVCFMDWCDEHKLKEVTDESNT